MPHARMILDENAARLFPAIMGFERGNDRSDGAAEMYTEKERDFRVCHVEQCAFYRESRGHVVMYVSRGSLGY